MNEGSIYRVENVGGTPTAMPYANLGFGDKLTPYGYTQGYDYQFSVRNDPFGVGDAPINSVTCSLEAYGNISRLYIGFQIKSTMLPYSVSAGIYSLFDQDLVNGERIKQAQPFYGYDPVHGIAYVRDASGLSKDVACELRLHESGGVKMARIRMDVRSAITIAGDCYFDFTFINRAGLT